MLSRNENEGLKNTKNTEAKGTFGNKKHKLLEVQESFLS